MPGRRGMVQGVDLSIDLSIQGAADAAELSTCCIPLHLATPLTGAGGAAESPRRGAGASLPEGRGGGGPGYDMNLVQYAAPELSLIHI